MLLITSPPYPLKTPRAYGNEIDSKAYITFIVESLEPLVAKLCKGGNIVLNLSQDIFETNSPARSDYLERLVITLKDELGLSHAIKQRLGACILVHKRPDGEHCE